MVELLNEAIRTEAYVCVVGVGATDYFLFNFFFSNSMSLLQVYSNFMFLLKSGSISFFVSKNFPSHLSYLVYFYTIIHSISLLSYIFL